MRWIAMVLAAFALLSCDSSGGRDDGPAIRVLFVGNSLTYTGNLPAVFEKLAADNGRISPSDMLVTGGATLTDRVKDGSVKRALSERRYSYVVLQERGGDFTCGFGPEVCVDARKSLAAIAAEARLHGAVPVLLGTYQQEMKFSQDIEEAEARAALADDIPYIAVSERLRSARSAAPGMVWYAPDGMHPGHDLILMEALLLYEQLYGAHAATSGLSVEAPMYTYESLLLPEVRPASAPASQADTPFGTRYESARVAWMKAHLRGDNPQLKALHDADQADRSSQTIDADWRELTRRDVQRRDAVLDLLRDGEVRTAPDYYHAAMVLQHGQSADDIRLAHSLSSVSATIDPSNRSARWLTAASWDRLMLQLKKPQWYGTQYLKNASGRWELYAVDASAVTDADREALDVPSLSESQKNMDKLNVASK